MHLLLQSAQNRIIVLFIAAAVDLLIGDPHGLWHPVQGIGSLISVSERSLRSLFAVPPRQDDAAGEGVKIRERIAGILMVFLVLLMSTAVVLFLLEMYGRFHCFLATEEFHFGPRLYFKIQAGTACGKWTNLAVCYGNVFRVF